MLMNSFLIQCSVKLAVISVLSVKLALAAATLSKPHKGLIMDIEVLHGNHIDDALQYKTMHSAKRSEKVLEIENMLTFYVSTISVGSRGEKSKVMIDTGSPDLWVMGNDLLCEYSPDGVNPADARKGPRHPQASLRHTLKVSDCHMAGLFSPGKSSTYYHHQGDADFSTHYLDDSYANGVWGTDKISVSGADIRMTFGVASKTSCPIGKLGLAPMFEEEDEQKPNDGRTFTNFPMSLQQAGVIKKPVYSIFLNTSSSSKGKIYFGVIDHKKYSSKLLRVPILNLNKNSRKRAVPAIKLDHMYLENGNHKVAVLNEPVGAVLDTSATVQHLPENVLHALANLLSGRYLAEAGMYEIDCSGSKSNNLVYDFAGIKIKVPLEDLVIERRGLCYLGAKSSAGTSYYKTARLGTSFLRHAYVVYDMEHMEIAMAQAQYSDEEDLEEVTNTIPRAAKAPRYSSRVLKIDIKDMRALNKNLSS